MKNLIRVGVVLVSVATSAPLLTACSVDATQEEQVTGSVTMALNSFTNGTEYRLSNAQFEIDGPVSTVLFSDDSEAILSAVLPVGGYTSHLASGWSLQRNDGGTFVNVQATLVSANPADFTISEGANTSLVYQFNTNGTIITIGSGQLDISIQVNETGSTVACDAFGAGCGAEEWCVPGSLFGGDNQCTLSGPLAPGEACDGMIACGTNALCGDIGLGQVCLELCPPESIGELCPFGGGICTEVGSPDYALCQ